jgi:hypothetical protein
LLGAGALLGLLQQIRRPGSRRAAALQAAEIES